MFHVDAAQATGKVDIDLAKLPVDLMSLSAHKTYGPKGIGALYVRRKPRVRLEAQMHGGGHERGMRSGTLPTHQIVGMGEAFRIAKLEMGAENERIRALRDRLLDGPAGIEEVLRQRRPGAPRAAQPERQLQLRRGRVADHGDQGHRGVVRFGLHLGQPGAVLRAARAGPQRRAGAQLDPLHASAASPPSEEIDYAIDLLHATRSAKLRELSPLWEMHQDGIDLEHGPVGCALKPHSDVERPGEAPWPTAKKSSTTTKIRAMSASFDKDDDGVGTGMVGAPACGDVMKLQIKVNAARHHRGRASSRPTAAARPSPRPRW